MAHADLDRPAPTPRNSSPAIGAMNHLLSLLCRSLPRYLQDAVPWTNGTRSDAQDALAHLIADQQLFACRVAEQIMALGGRPEPGCFPTEFTSLNDADLRFVLGRVVARQRDDIETMRHLVTELSAVPEAQALAEEVLGNTQGHLDILQAL